MFYCVHGDTEIRTPDGYVKAKDISIGQTITSYSLNETGKHDIETWSSESIIDDMIVETSIKGIKVHRVAATLTLNGSKTRRFSLDHVILIKRNDVYMFAKAGTIAIGDYLVYDINNKATDVLVEKIVYIDEETDVYEFSLDTYDLFIAGDIIVHNAKNFF